VRSWGLGVFLCGCAAPEAPEGAPLRVMARQDDGSYAPEDREVPDLHDPVRLRGELATGWRGGRIGSDEYARGRELRIDFAEDGDALVPLDVDGLVLWSFYAHLSEADADLTDRGFTLDMFPVDVAFAPVSFLDFSAVENAAWVTGQDVFVVFPEAVSSVPLPANAGVVRHELAHAWFEQLTTDEDGNVGWLEAGSTSGAGLLRLRSLNEGFADMVATLSLDDPRFIDASLPMASRDVTTDVTSEGRYPPEAPGAVESLSYDPYELGTVYASVAWDVREATDPDTALQLVVGALQDWAAVGEWGDTDAWLVHLADRAEGDAKTAACESIALRFPHVVVDGC
jgi:hypothetical protein